MDDALTAAAGALKASELKEYAFGEQGTALWVEARININQSCTHRNEQGVQDQFL